MEGCENQFRWSLGALDVLAKRFKAVREGVGHAFQPCTPTWNGNGMSEEGLTNSRYYSEILRNNWRRGRMTAELIYVLLSISPTNTRTCHPVI
jgi:hypothetical protein